MIPLKPFCSTKMLNKSNSLLLIVTVVRYLHQNLIFFPHQFSRQ